MQIKFVRSGGFAGAATEVEGTVTIEPDGGKVAAGTAGYQRELPAEEAEHLRTAAARPQQQAGAAAPSPVRDGFQYDITIQTDEGETHNVTVSEGAMPGGADKLVKWVQQEARKILAERARGR